MKILALMLVLTSAVLAACPGGYTQVTGPLPQADGSGMSGTLQVRLGYSLLPLAVEGNLTVTITNGSLSAANNGGLLCLAPAVYTVTYRPSGSTLTYPRTWTVPPAGPVTVGSIESASAPSPSQSAPFPATSLTGAPAGTWCLRSVGGVTQWAFCSGPYYTTWDSLPASMSWISLPSPWMALFH